MNKFVAPPPPVGDFVAPPPPPALEKIYDIADQPMTPTVAENEYFDDVEQVTVDDATVQRFASFDVECYANYFLLTMFDLQTKEVIREFEMYNDVLRTPTDRTDLHAYLKNYTIVSFNGIKYDMLVVTGFINGASNRELKFIGDEVIKGGMMPWDFEKRYAIRIPNYDHIDLIELAHGMHSLKVYGARLRAKKLQELPIHFDNLIMPHEVPLLQKYCVNDNVVTDLLFDDCKLAIELRVELSREYGMDLRSKSDAQAAEAIFASEVMRLNGVKMVKPNMKTHPREFVYNAPPFIQFQSDRMKELVGMCENQTYELSEKHKIKVPPEFGTIRFYSDEKEGHMSEINLSVFLMGVRYNELKNQLDDISANLALARKRKNLDRIANYTAQRKEFVKEPEWVALLKELKDLKDEQEALTIRKYTMQIGGLHSQNDSGSHYATDEYDIFEIDVSSFYPNIIINANLYIQSIGKEVFQKIYIGLIDRKNNASARIKELKDQGITSGEEFEKQTSIIKAIKIFINGLYGKLSSHYSKVFSPDMLIGTTITGQLSLMMLLEIFHEQGIHVLSANTDGINVRVHKSQRQWIDDVVDWWCELTGFVMDYNHYKSIHYRDVNNYFAHYESGKVKGIGMFASESIRISPEYFIVRDACFDFVKNNTPVEDTVNNCDDIHQFINLRKVTGGALKDGEAIGAAIRWYHSTMTSTPIIASKSGNKVANSDGGMPVMDYPDEIPIDLDREWYIRKTYHALIVTGVLTDDHCYMRHEGSDVVWVANDIDQYVDHISNGEVDVIDREQFIAAIGVTKAERKKYGVR